MGNLAGDVVDRAGRPGERVGDMGAFGPSVVY